MWLQLSGASFKKLLASMIEHDAAGVAAEMAYNIMLAFMPALVFLVSMVGLIGHEKILWLPFFLDNLHRLAPSGAAKLIEETLSQVIQGSSGQVAVLGLLGTLWSGSNVGSSLIKGLNTAYQVQEARSYWYTRSIGVAMVLSLGFLIVLGANLLFFGEFLLSSLERLFFFDLSGLYTVLPIGWIVMFVLLVFLSTTMYLVCPNFKFPRAYWIRTSLPGGILFSLLWISVSALFGLYVDKLANYNQVYGALGGVIILMIWLYLSSLAILMGGEFNAIQQLANEDVLKPS